MKCGPVNSRAVPIIVTARLDHPGHAGVPHVSAVMVLGRGTVGCSAVAVRPVVMIVVTRIVAMTLTQTTHVSKHRSLMIGTIWRRPTDLILW